MGVLNGVKCVEFPIYWKEISPFLCLHCKYYNKTTDRCQINPITIVNNQLVILTEIIGECKFQE